MVLLCRAKRNIIAAVGCAVTFMMMMSGCAVRPQAVTRDGIFFDTSVSITVYDNVPGRIANDTLDGCFSLLGQYEKLFSKTIETSDISRINDAGGAEVVVDGDTVGLLTMAREYSLISGGAFDITVGGVMELWNFKSDMPQLPDSDALAEAVTHVGYSKVVIDGNTVRLDDPGTRLDIGGIAKGYAADRIEEYILSQGIMSAFINFGGDTLAIGQKPDGSAWRVGIAGPSGDTNADVVAVCGKSVVTSGIGYRGFTIEGQRYHHIINPGTGMPADNGLLSVSVACAGAARADALATACFIMGSERGMEMVEMMDNTEVLFIGADGSLESSGWSLLR